MRILLFQQMLLIACSFIMNNRKGKQTSPDKIKRIDGYLENRIAWGSYPDE